MPAVFYGRGESATPVLVPLNDFEKVWKKAGESSVVMLKGDFGEKEVLIYEVDLDPITDKPRHADFYVVGKGQKVKIKVPLKFSGVAPAVKDLGGILVKVVHELEVEAEPKNLPKFITVDISGLADFTSRVLAKDIKLPPDVKLLINPEEVVAAVAEPREETAEPAPTVDLSSIEISEKRGKEEIPKEAAGAAAPAAASEKKEEKQGKK